MTDEDAEDAAGLGPPNAGAGASVRGCLSGGELAPDVEGLMANPRLRGVTAPAALVAGAGAGRENSGSSMKFWRTLRRGAQWVHCAWDVVAAAMPAARPSARPLRLAPR